MLCKLCKDKSRAFKWRPLLHISTLACLVLFPSSAAATPKSDSSSLTSARSLLQGPPSAAADLLCGASEYSCGDSDIVLDLAYTAAQSSNCSLDTDLQVYICNDFILTAAEYLNIQSTKGSCESACSLSSASLAVPSQYYWVVSNWTACSVVCGGGTQARAASCMNSISGGQAGASLCDGAGKPIVRQPCNLTPCQVQERGLTLSFTPWDSCEASCGSDSFAKRDAFCTDSLGNLADVSACGSYRGAQLSQACTSSPCSGAHWLVGDWSECSATCGGGNVSRLVECVDGQEKTVDNSECQGLEIPTDSGSCNTQPCVGYTWSVGDWRACSLSCGGGVQNRSVECVDQHGSPANATLCPGKPPADELQCNVLPCNFCSQTTCAGQGVCKNGVCVCQPGYRGSYCEIPPQCPGILDAAGNCCDHGVVDKNGTCCAVTAVLDGSAQCCNSGKIDACGVCNGAAKLVDVQNVCCQSGVLDAAGYCCASGLLDECGVCDGASMSCALSTSVRVQVSTPSALFSLGSQAFVSTFSDFISSIFEVNETQISVLDFTLVPGVLVDANDDPVQMQVDFDLNPADTFTPKQDLKASAATRTLQDAVGEASNNKLFILTGVVRVQRTAVCGNQVCEAGERSPPGSTTGCSGDCPFLLQPCPAPATNSTPCAGNGRCLTAEGTCICFLGYSGGDCSQCAEGYIRSGNSCARYVKADLPLLNASSSASVLVVLAVGIATAVLGAAFLAIAVAVIVRQRRQLRGYRRIRRRGSLKTPLRAAEIKPKEANPSGKPTKRSGSGTDNGTEDPDESGSGEGELVDRSLPSLFDPTARAKSVIDVARMYGESVAAMRANSTSAVSMPAKQSATKPVLAHIRSSGRMRRVPQLRELQTSSPERETAGPGKSPSKMAEKAALRRKLKLLDPAGSTSRRAKGNSFDSNGQQSAIAEYADAPMDAAATVVLTPKAGPERAEKQMESPFASPNSATEFGNQQEFGSKPLPSHALEAASSLESFASQPLKPLLGSSNLTAKGDAIASSSRITAD